MLAYFIILFIYTSRGSSKKSDMQIKNNVVIPVYLEEKLELKPKLNA